MPNITVLATGEAMSAARINRSQIMKEPWASYNRHYDVRPWLKRTYNRADFAWNLRLSWDAARLAEMLASERRRVQIEREIEALKYKSLRINIEPMRARLEAELRALA